MNTAKHTRPRQLLARILEEPALVSTIQSLEPRLLARLVRHIGLEDAGELAALATPQQLMEVFDEDLWSRDAAGEDETFDAARFALWLEILLESGAKLAADKVAGLDEDMLTFALCRNVLVIDIEQLARTMSAGGRSDDGDLLEKELEGYLYQEFEQFRVIAKDPRTWEPIRTVLVELDAEHTDLFLRLLERCCDISSQYVDDNGGLYEVLSSEAMLEEDVVGQREDRRATQGYVAPSLARAFLAHARVESLETLLQSDAVDPSTRAYFRDSAARAVQPAPSDESAAPRQPAPSADWWSLLREVEIVPTQPALLGSGGEAAELHAEPLVVNRAMRALRERDERAYAERLNELAYLSNVLLSGCAHEGRELRPVEAAQAALACCNLGAERLLGHRGEAPGDARALADLLGTGTLVKLFRLGWHLYFAEIIVPAAERACALLARADADSDAVTPAFRALKALRTELAAKRPWRAAPNLTRLVEGVRPEDARIVHAALQELPRALFDERGGADALQGLIATESTVGALRSRLAALSPDAAHPEPPTPPKTKRARR